MEASSLWFRKQLIEGSIRLRLVQVKMFIMDSLTYKNVNETRQRFYNLQPLLLRNIYNSQFIIYPDFIFWENMAIYLFL